MDNYPFHDGHCQLILKTCAGNLLILLDSAVAADIGGLGTLAPAVNTVRQLTGITITQEKRP